MKQEGNFRGAFLCSTRKRSREVDKKERKKKEIENTEEENERKKKEKEKGRRRLRFSLFSGGGAPASEFGLKLVGEREELPCIKNAKRDDSKNKKPD